MSKTKTVVKDPRKNEQAAPPAAKTPAATGNRRIADVEEDRRVRVEVPTAFRLHTTPGVIIPYEAGIQRMPQSHADHPYSKACGVRRPKAGDDE